MVYGSYSDQAGIFVGRNSGTLTRAGVIVLSGALRPFSVYTELGSDRNARFGENGFDGTDGMTVLIAREAGVWRYFVDGAEWNLMSGELKEEPAFLDGHGDLITGVFAINPLNDTPKTVELDSFSALVVNGDTTLTQIEAWRNTHFGSPDPAGSAANLADANGNGIPNLLEYALGRDPVSPEAGAPVGPVFRCVELKWARPEFLISGHGTITRRSRRVLRSHLPLFKNTNENMLRCSKIGKVTSIPSLTPAMGVSSASSSPMPGTRARVRPPGDSPRGGRVVGLQNGRKKEGQSGNRLPF